MHHRRSYLERAHRSDTLEVSSETSIKQFYDDREFIETVELLLRKSIDFLSNFHEQSLFKLSNLNQRLTIMERKLDLIEASLQHCDPSTRGAEPIPFKGSVFDKSVRHNIIKQTQMQRNKSMIEYKNIVKPPTHSLQKTIRISISDITNTDTKNTHRTKTSKVSIIHKRPVIACDDKNAKPSSIVVSKPPKPQAKYTIDVSKYDKMKRIGLPLNAILNKMRMDGVSASIINEYSINQNQDALNSKSVTPSPELSSIDSTFYNKDGRINKKGSLHRTYGPPPKVSRSPTPINIGMNKPRRLPMGLAAQIKTKHKLKSHEKPVLSNVVVKPAVPLRLSEFKKAPPPRNQQQRSHNKPRPPPPRKVLK
eukprot:836069_1